MTKLFVFVTALFVSNLSKPENKWLLRCVKPGKQYKQPQVLIFIQSDYYLYA